LIFGNFRVHSAHLVRDWIKRHRDEKEVTICQYSPEINPDDYLNGDLKRHIPSAAPARIMK
jgi:hypothetical protein